MSLFHVLPPQNFVFCGADFGSTIALNLQQKLDVCYIPLNSKCQCFLFFEIIVFFL